MAVKTSKKPTAATKKSKVDSTSKFSKETYIKWWKDMLLIRKFEEKTGQLYGQQKIRGFCHLYIGQEAVVAGAISAMGPEDSMITSYRDQLIYGVFYGILLLAGAIYLFFYFGIREKSFLL